MAQDTSTPRRGSGAGAWATHHARAESNQRATSNGARSHPTLSTLLARLDGTGLHPDEPRTVDVGSYVLARASG